MEIMKRDMDLCRTILFEVEKFPFRTDWINLKIDGYSKDEIAYHVMILNQAGLIDARNLDTLTDWRPINLTWEGHEFLDAARDNKRWEKAKSAMSQLGGFVFDVGKQLLVQYLRQELNLT